MLARQFNLFKARGITTMATILTEGDAETAVGVSSQADTWLLLRNDESNGERNRLLFVLKSRGSAIPTRSGSSCSPITGPSSSTCTWALRG